jgi:lipoyl(octanoyl) transferase
MNQPARPPLEARSGVEPRQLRQRQLGRVYYQRCWQAMRAFTDRRDHSTSDECWVVEHQAVYTQGLGGRPEHLLSTADIPVVHTDRGGQVTYHGPGQLIVYLLLDLARAGTGVRQMVRAVEAATLDCLGEMGIAGECRAGAPGVYVAGRKIASLGLRVRRGCSYHGLSLNVAMDLSPFAGIDTCGFPGLEVTQLRDLGVDITPAETAKLLLPALMVRLDYADLLNGPELFPELL